MKTLTEFIQILESNDIDNILDNTLMLSNYRDIRKKIKAYIKKNFTNINKIYLVFDNIENAQAWVDFSYFDEINGKKFGNLDGNFIIDTKLFNKCKTYLNDVTNKDLLDSKENNLPFLSITAFGNKIKIVYSNRLKVDKYNITTYLTEI